MEDSGIGTGHGHKDLYKATFNKKNPLWKEKFKQKCLLKAQQSKTSKVAKYRDINHLIDAEWSEFRGTDEKKVDLWSPEELTPQDYLDVMQYLQEQLQEEGTLFTSQC